MMLTRVSAGAGVCTSRAASRRSVVRAPRSAAAGDYGTKSSSDEKQPVRQVPDPSPLEIIEKLSDINPNKIGVDTLAGYPFAVQKGKVFVADPPTVDSWMNREWQLGTITDWPESISKLLGAEAMASTRSAEQHAKLREIFGVMLSNAQVERMLPSIQATVQRYLKDWSSRGTVAGYTEMLTLIFDVIINTSLQLGWPDADIKKYVVIFETWNQGFTVFANPLPWSKYSQGMRAREELIARFRASLKDPKLPAGSIPAVLRDTYGADSPVCTDNLIMVVFAGFETTCGLCTGLLWHMARDPAALTKLRDEQTAVSKAHGGKLTLESIKDMRYTGAALDEVLRLSQMVANVPRKATRDLDLKRGPPVPAGCPMSVAFGAMSLRDPAVKGSEKDFKPERWLTEAGAASKPVYQNPFGWGQHDCVGRRVARSIATAVAQELSLRYKLAADATDEWDNFPTGGRMKNGLPLTLTPL